MPWEEKQRDRIQWILSELWGLHRAFDEEGQQEWQCLRFQLNGTIHIYNATAEAMVPLGEMFKYYDEDVIREEVARYARHLLEEDSLPRVFKDYRHQEGNVIYLEDPRGR